MGVSKVKGGRMGFGVLERIERNMSVGRKNNGSKIKQYRTFRELNMSKAYTASPPNTTSAALTP
jgi:hypothetical protein